jgi:sporulation protein YtfJ
MKENHPIEGLILTAMSSIRDMVDVNTIIGEPIESVEGMIIIPISKVSFGFVAGGSEFTGETVNEYSKKEDEELVQYRLPFGGGAGAGASINPVAFLLVQKGTARILPIEHTSCIDKLLDYVPDLMEKVNQMINKTMKTQNEKTEKIVEQIRKNSENYNHRKDFREKDFEEKTSNEFELKHRVSTDVDETNYEVKRQEAESDGEDF